MCHKVACRQVYIGYPLRVEIELNSMKHAGLKRNKEGNGVKLYNELPEGKRISFRNILNSRHSPGGRLGGFLPGCVC